MEDGSYKETNDTDHGPQSIENLSHVWEPDFSDKGKAKRIKAESESCEYEH